MGDVTLVIDADTAKAVRDLVKLAQSQGTLERKTKELGETSKKSGKEAADALENMTNSGNKATTSLGGVTQATTSLAKSIGGMIAGSVGLGTVAQLAREVAANFKAAAVEGDRVAKAMLPLSVQTAGKEAGASARALLMGAKEGLTPEESGTIANTLKSIQGSNFVKDFQTAAVLKNLGVEGQDAAPIVQAGVVRGIGSMRAADLALGAADLASWAPADVAKVIPKTLGYASMEEGLAAGATLRTAGIPMEQMPASVEALGRVLNKDATPLAKKFHLKGLSAEQRLDLLSAKADASGDRDEYIRKLPEKYKLGEEEGRALVAALSVKPEARFGKNLAALRGIKAGDAQARLDKVMEDPKVRSDFETRRSEALVNATKANGPAGDIGRALRTSEEADTMTVQRLAPWAPTEGLFGSLTSGVMKVARGYATGGGGGIAASALPASADARLATATERAVTAMERLADITEQNTKATETNTGATGGGDAGPSIAQRRNR